LILNLNAYVIIFYSKNSLNGLSDTNSSPRLQGRLKVLETVLAEIQEGGG